MADESADKNGIYIIALESHRDDPRFKIEFIREWVKYVYHREFGVDYEGNEVLYQQIEQKLSPLWLKEERILYIGRASGKNTVRKRVSRYYGHILGQCGHHRGGQILKTLEDWKQMKIYWTETNNPITIESELLRIFCAKSGGKLPFCNKKL